jgi:hypothetical protein
MLRSFPPAVDAWLQDHFGLRALLIHWNNLISFHCFHISPSGKVLVGRDGWLYYAGDPEGEDGDPITDYRGTQPLSDAHLDYLRWMIQDQAEWLHARGMTYLFVLVPSKPEMYPEFMPPGLTRVGPTPREQLLAWIEDKPDLPVLDLLPALQQARERKPVYMKTDSHWNDYGAYVGYREIINALSNQFTVLRACPESMFEMHTTVGPGRDLSHMIDLSEELREEMLRMRPMRPRRAQRRALSEEELADIVSAVDDEQLPTAVVYRDSFANRLIPYLAEHFRQARYEWARKGTEMHGIEDCCPDVVLQIMNDRALRLGLKYSGKMRFDLARTRFAESTNILAQFNAETGFSGIQPVCRMELAVDHDALIAHAKKKHAAFSVPVDFDPHAFFPLIHLRISAPHDTRMALFWARDGAYSDATRWRAPLEKGVNDIILPLPDWQMEGPLHIYFGKVTGDYMIDRIEIRGVPR